MKYKRSSDGRAHSHEALQTMRQQAVKVVREGQVAPQVAAVFGLNVRTVYRWLADFANGGQNALLAKAIPGRPPKIWEEEMLWLAQNILRCWCVRGNRRPFRDPPRSPRSRRHGVLC